MRIIPEQEYFFFKYDKAILFDNVVFQLKRKQAKTVL